MTITPDGIGERALRFLATHRLAQTPEHYAFAYRYVTGQGREFSDAVDHYIEGGIRLREEAVRELAPDQPWPDLRAGFDGLTTHVWTALRWQARTVA